MLTLEVQLTSSPSSSSSLSWEYRLHRLPLLGITSSWFPNLLPDLLHIGIDQVILRGSSPWMTAKTNKYHYSHISFDSSYNSRGVTFFHVFLMLNGLMGCIYIALFCSSLIKVISITSVYSPIHTLIQTPETNSQDTTCSFRRTRHAGACIKDPAILGLSISLKDTFFKD